MASRNKKGRIHGIFKSEFQISFFHKPSMEKTDIYYYVVLENLIFMKMRFLYNIVLVIDEIYPLTSSYIESYYERLFNLLKDQTSVTVVVSLMGSTTAFKPTCMKFDTPVIEHESFIDVPIEVYNKYKNYCGNDSSYFGFYLIALKEETLSIIESSNEEVSVEEEVEETISPKDTKEPIKEPVVENKQPAPTNDDKPKNENILPTNMSILYRFLENKFHRVSINQKNDSCWDINIGQNDIEVVDNGYDIQIEILRVASNLALFDLIGLLEDTVKTIKKNISIIGIPPENVLCQMLNDRGWVEISGTGSLLYNDKRRMFIQRWSY